LPLIGVVVSLGAAAIATASARLETSPA